MHFRIAALQVQRVPVKIGKAPLRYYEPAALVPVVSIKVGPRGVYGITTEDDIVLDVRH